MNPFKMAKNLAFFRSCNHLSTFTWHRYNVLEKIGEKDLGSEFLKHCISENTAPYSLGSGIGADRIMLYSFFASSTFFETLSIFCRVSSICKLWKDAEKESLPQAKKGRPNSVKSVEGSKLIFITGIHTETAIAAAMTIMQVVESAFLLLEAIVWCSCLILQALIWRVYFTKQGRPFFCIKQKCNSSSIYSHHPSYKLGGGINIQLKCSIIFTNVGKSVSFASGFSFPDGQSRHIYALGTDHLLHAHIYKWHICLKVIFLRLCSHSLFMASWTPMQNSDLQSSLLLASQQFASPYHYNYYHPQQLLNYPNPNPNFLHLLQ